MARCRLLLLRVSAMMFSRLPAFCCSCRHAVDKQHQQHILNAAAYARHAAADAADVIADAAYSATLLI